MSVAERAEVKKYLSCGSPKFSVGPASTLASDIRLSGAGRDGDLWCAWIGDPSAAFALEAPHTPASAAIFASPHSGRFYPAEFVDAANCQLSDLRQFEDAFVDHLFASAPEAGAAFLQALYARAFIDLNRSEDEIDPEMLIDSEGETIRPFQRTQSHRVLAGLGIVPKLAADGRPLYPRQMTFGEVSRRIEHAYAPYHAKLAELLASVRARFGGVVLIDCHSMPSSPIPGLRSARQPDIVIGDRFGQSAHPRIVARIETMFRKMGYRVARNTPYAGGHVTHYYGRPQENQHVIQIEVNRGLYLDETRFQPGAGFGRLARDLHSFCAEIVEMSQDIGDFAR